jgi:hypothetical protein
MLKLKSFLLGPATRRNFWQHCRKLVPISRVRRSCRLTPGIDGKTSFSKTKKKSRIRSYNSLSRLVYDTYFSTMHIVRRYEMLCSVKRLKIMSNQPIFVGFHPLNKNTWISNHEVNSIWICNISDNKTNDAYSDDNEMFSLFIIEMIIFFLTTKLNGPRISLVERKYS